MVSPAAAATQATLGAILLLANLEVPSPELISTLIMACTKQFNDLGSLENAFSGSSSHESHTTASSHMPNGRKIS
jgi:hypothetical protein